MKIEIVMFHPETLGLLMEISKVRKQLTGMVNDAISNCDNRVKFDDLEVIESKEISEEEAMDALDGAILF